MSTPGTSAAVSSVACTTIRVASTWSTTPERSATIAAPESRATLSSIPVPTKGASACSKGTACRCIFEPIKARFASSFSRNGINAAATETICFGETSIKSISSRIAMMYSPPSRQLTSSSTNLPRLSKAALACATV